MPYQNKIDHPSINKTKKWLTSFIIEYGICPFAKREFVNNRIHYQVIETNDLQAQLEQVLNQCISMDENPQIETSLLIFSNALQDFDDYLDVLTIATEIFESQGYAGIYQLASFHPNYQFDGQLVDDASNYTNRSPYPMLHILREASLEKVLLNYPEPENIPIRNIALMQKLGTSRLKKLLAQCYEI